MTKHEEHDPEETAQRREVIRQTKGKRPERRRGDYLEALRDIAQQLRRIADALEAEGGDS